MPAGHRAAAPADGAADGCVSDARDTFDTCDVSYARTSRPHTPRFRNTHARTRARDPSTNQPPDDDWLTPLRKLAAALVRVEQFYDSMGGLIGYQLKSTRLIVANAAADGANANATASGAADGGSSSATSSSSSSSSSSAPAAQPQGGEVRYHVPPALDLAGEAGRRVGARAAAQGILSLPFMAEILPVGGARALLGCLCLCLFGWAYHLAFLPPLSHTPPSALAHTLTEPSPPQKTGAGDRLGLKCDVTGESLPSAMLPYAGRPMIELLVRDLQVGVDPAVPVGWVRLGFGWVSVGFSFVGDGL